MRLWEIDFFLGGEGKLGLELFIVGTKLSVKVLLSLGLSRLVF